MANYQLVDIDQLEADLTTVGDAIRSRVGTTGKMAFPTGMAIAASMQTNDTTREDGLIARTLTTYTNENGLSVGDNAFLFYNGLTSVNFLKATTIGFASFEQCLDLTTANFPEAIAIGEYAFDGCTSLTEINLPKIITISSNAFSDCENLVTATFPSAAYIATSAFYGCHNLDNVDFSQLQKIYNVSFQNCYSLKTVIIRNNNQVCTLANTKAFDGCYHFHGTVHSTYNPDGLIDGFIYVPRLLYSEYNNATNWSALGGNIRILEDYTVDGTTTGELDAEKVKNGVYGGGGTN